MTLNNIKIHSGRIYDKHLKGLYDTTGLTAKIDGNEDMDYLINAVMEKITSNSKLFDKEYEIQEYGGKLIDRVKEVGAFILDKPANKYPRDSAFSVRQGIFGLLKDKSSGTLKSTCISYFSHMNYQGNLNPFLWKLNEGMLEYHFSLMGGSHEEFFLLTTLENIDVWQNLKNPLNIHPFTLYDL